MSDQTLRHLLIVDDDATLRERLARALRERGYTVETASDVPEALASARLRTPDGVVLDLKMSGSSGLDALRELRTIAPSARALILTGYGSIATALEAVRLGAWDYLTKPADADQIIAALSRDPMLHGVTPELEPPSLDRAEWEYIQRVLSDCGGNVSQTAKILGIHRRSLQRKLNKYPPQR